MKAFLVSLSKAILKLAIDEALRRGLPKIYEKLDAKLPNMLFNSASPDVVEKEIEFAIRNVIGKPVTRGMIDVVTSLYDPVQNAKAIRRSKR